MKINYELKPDNRITRIEFCCKAMSLSFLTSAKELIQKFYEFDFSSPGERGFSDRAGKIHFCRYCGARIELNQIEGSTES